MCSSDLNKTIWGWGTNSCLQVTGVKGSETIYTPTPIKIPVYVGEHLKIVVGATTTYLLSSKSLDIDYDKYESPLKTSPSDSSE